MTLLDVKNLAVNAGELSLVDGVTLDVASGEIVAVVGESGSGKSLTACSIMGLLGEGLTVTGGSVFLDQVNLMEMTQGQMNDLRGDSIAMIFQEPVASLNPLIPVGVQVAESLIVHGEATSKEAFRRAVEMLEMVGIPEPAKRARQLPAELSGGMCQRVMIAAALISEPKLLIADEPTTALDVTIQAQILELMYDLTKRSNTAILLITHDMGVVAEMADRVCVMYGGCIVEQGPAAEIFDSPRHPYTRMLLETLPRLDGEPKRDLFTIPGSVPSPKDWPDGCRFQTRCDRPSEACKTKPNLKGAGHRVACFHPLEASA